MGTPTKQASQAGAVQVRYWASARAAAGVDSETVELLDAASVADVVAALLARRPGQEATHLARVLEVCSVLVGEQPTKDPTTLVAPGCTLEFLPPFAGG